ncbi:MAG: UDP-4-amino-4,6-dideoxy-N-acetyl-beta-L-altrosamine transaminase [Candidatus Puniceispirillum sp. TMED52]|nr:MAG: UDP-4-amino-4,6-dideoxy-N-acetyl-beta-L-altrosamine transaminase [Candidatus Puniceispirillum sp. TMED52]|tara:strand:+ start:471 stop:1631 length:1161 start_codon:yes stop_codon:yes gene_type:complete
MSFIPYGRQSISQADIKAVTDVLESDFLTQGPAVPIFENMLAEICNAAAACATNSATSALHIACLALGVGKGDVVWTSPISFVSSANCARLCGADVDFVDVDPDTTNICVEALELKLQVAFSLGKIPKVLIAVHMGGRSCEMEKIFNLCSRYNVRIIEDASHATGGLAYDEPVGSCKYSDLCVFSFHPVKIVTTGEGGAIVGNDENMVSRCKLLRSHGVTRDLSQMEGEPDGDWYYEQITLGLNYRMTDLQAALGASQIKSLGDFICRRRALADLYRDELSDVPLDLPPCDDHIKSAWHLFVVQTGDSTGNERGELFRHLRSAEIGVNVHYKPIHTQPYYMRLGFSEGQYPSAEVYYRKALSLPIHPALSDDQLTYIVTKVKDFYR